MTEELTHTVREAIRLAESSTVTAEDVRPMKRILAHLWSANDELDLLQRHLRLHAGNGAPVGGKACEVVGDDAALL
jgi:hypothetical protein